MKTLLAALALTSLVAACRSTPTPAQTAPVPEVETCMVEGCVERPGPQTLEGYRTVFEAIQAAGPIEGRSDLRRVLLVRGSGEDALEILIDVAQIFETGDSSFNVLLRAGDVLRVPSR